MAARPSTSHVSSVRGTFPDLLRLLVELVTNLTDDLFEEVFHRDDPARAAVLVDDDGDRDQPRCISRNHVDAALHLRHEEDVPA